MSDKAKLRDDCFALPSGVVWTPVDAALSHLRAEMRPVARIETLPAGLAAGRILAAPVIAGRDNPPWTNAAVDGYGFDGVACPAGSLSLPLVSGRAAAGAPFAGTLRPGSALRILTGAALPLGVDTVVLEEDVTLKSGRVEIPAGWKRGANTRPKGEDVKADAPLFDAGRTLRAPDLALLAAAGVAAVQVRRPLRVAVLSTGDELAPDGAPPQAHQIPDANRPMLLALLRAWGMAPVDLGQAPDTEAGVAESLDQGARADAILTTGGASAGDEDHISRALRQAGTLALWRIAVKPGRPLALGLWQGVPIFGLPGNPVAAFTCALIFARPALLALAGGGWRPAEGITVPAAFAKTKKAGRREFLRARLREGRAEVFASEGSGRVSGLAWAEGFVELPDDAGSVQPGDPVRYLPFRAFGL